MFEGHRKKFSFFSIVLKTFWRHDNEEVSMDKQKVPKKRHFISTYIKFLIFRHVRSINFWEIIFKMKEGKGAKLEKMDKIQRNQFSGSNWFFFLFSPREIQTHFNWRNEKDSKNWNDDYQKSNKRKRQYEEW